MRKCTIFLVVTIFFVSGCVSIDTINKKYERINLKNRISDYEAKIIAQKSLLDSGQIDEYIYEKPFVDDFVELHKRYPDFIFIHFALESDSNEGYLVIINKEYAKIKYSGPFNPVVEKSYDRFF